MLRKRPVHVAFAAVGMLACGGAGGAPVPRAPLDTPMDAPPADGPLRIGVRDGRTDRARQLVMRFLLAVDRADRDALRTLLTTSPWRTARLEYGAARHELDPLIGLLAADRRSAARPGAAPPARLGRLPFEPRAAVSRARVRRLDDPSIRWRHARSPALRASDLLVEVPVPGASRALRGTLRARRGQLRILVRPEASLPVIGF